MQDSFFKKMTVASFASAVTLAAAFACLGRSMWALGSLAGFCWIYLNSFFLFRLIDTAFGGKPAQKNTVMVLSILKFPVLYAAGFFVLKSRVFPTGSILSGLTIFIVAFGITWMIVNPARVLERSAP